METQTMTKKNIKPQQAAPVQREINTTSSVVGGTVHPQQYTDKVDSVLYPFAGDDAE
jgi:prenylated cyclic peptide (anacyclamide/piricyclamide family)